MPALALIIALLALPASAAARPPVDRSDDLWATVNVCDSAAYPDRIGIRGSMPGLGRRARLQMRFQVQYLAAHDGKWHNLRSGGDSGFKTVGTSRTAVVEAGQNFTFPPPAGGKHTLRGAVTFRWRRAGRTIRRIRELTEAGHTSTRGADPPGYSAATCEIS